MKIKKQFILVLLLVFFFVSARLVFAVGNTTGYGWGEGVGWFNFNSTHGGGVTVASDGVTGYVWQENVGWILLDYDGVAGATNTNSTNWGVTNDGSGNLAGYAWSESAGWINFNPTHSQVTIDGSGNFAGYAWSENMGWILMDHSQTSDIPNTTWSASPCPGGMSGMGIEDDECLITSWTDLDQVRNGLTLWYKLTADLSSTTPDYHLLGDDWTPIGDNSNYPDSAFSGNFNGNNKTISDLTINKPGVDYVGLFGYVTGNISNVNLNVVNVTGQNNVGGLVGYQNGGTISNSSVSIADSQIINGSSNVGLIIGNNNGGTITSTYATVFDAELDYSTFGNTWTAKDSVRWWYGVAMSSDGKYQTAVVFGGYIYISTDYGNTWTPKDSQRSWYSVAMSSDGKYQTAVSSGYIYISTDYGNTWTPKDSPRGWISVAMSSDGKYQTAVDWGGYPGWGGYIYISTDYGNTWTPKDSQRSWYSVAMSSDAKYQTAVVDNGYIYISTDYGNTWTWTAIDSQRWWYGVAMSSDGKYQTATASSDYIYISTDYGSTWIAKDSQRDWRSVAMSSDGKYQTALEVGGYIYISTDYGNNWTAKGYSGTGRSVAMSSDGKYQTAVEYNGNIYTSVTDSTQTTRYGEITFNDWDVGLPGGGNILDYIQIGQNSAVVDSVNCPNCNKAATTTLNNTGVTGGSIFKDGVACGEGDGCTMVSSSGDDYVFTVTGWSEYSIGVLNTAPSFSAGPSDGSSSSTTPTNAGANVSFTATATDTQSDNYYLALCKTDAITANNEAVPTCTGGNWCISSSTASGVQASCTYRTSSSNDESNNWYAFVCDHNSASLCSASSQGSASPSPFAVNHAPSFSAIGDSVDPIEVGQQQTFTSTASDSDTNGSADTVTLYVCKSNDFTGSTCGSAGEWCHSSASASNPTCNYTILSGDGLGTKNYFGYIIDSHNFTPANNPKFGTFTISGGGTSSTLQFNGAIQLGGKLQVK